MYTRIETMFIRWRRPHTDDVTQNPFPINDPCKCHHLTYAIYIPRQRRNLQQFHKRSIAAKTDPMEPAIAPIELKEFEDAAPVKTAGAGLVTVGTATGVVTTTVGAPGQAVQVTAVVVKPEGTPVAAGVVPVAVTVTV